jgi:hypothetical protein
MIAKRIGAGLLAIVLILGAWLVRDRVIDDDGANADSADNGDNGDEGDDEAGEILYCISELRSACDAIGDQIESLDVRILPAGSTLDELAQADSTTAMWLTMAPLPEMVNTLRESRAADPIVWTSSTLATSPLSVVVLNDSSATLVTACGDPVDLTCLADQSALSPTFAGLDSASGMLGVAAAAAAFGGDALDLNDPQFTVWARRLVGAGATQLSGGTAVQTIQTRQTFDVAVGAEAELAEAQRPKFDVLLPAQPAQLDVVLAVPEGIDAGDRLARVARESLAGAGWQPPRPADAATGLPSPGVILAVRDIWEDLR